MRKLRELYRVWETSCPFPSPRLAPHGVRSVGSDAPDLSDAKCSRRMSPPRSRIPLTDDGDWNQFGLLESPLAGCRSFGMARPSAHE